MPMTNHELVGRALELLKQGLVPFVERELKNKHGQAWFEHTLSVLSESQARQFGTADKPRWDVATALGVVWNEWDVVFRASLGQAERTHIRELRDARNRWAHQEPFSNDHAYRTIDSTARLLTAISAPEASDARKMKTNLQRPRFVEQTAQSATRSSKPTKGTAATSFELKIGWSAWLGVAALYVISFRALAHLDGGERVLLALTGPVIILASVLAHELGHAFTMTIAGMKVQKIVLEIWGGYTQGAKGENPFKLPTGKYFWTFFAGPGTNFLIAFIAFLVQRKAAPGSTPQVVSEVVVGLNLYLGALNLIPVFPLDGGHVLRGILMAMTGRRVLATLISASLSIALGAVGLIYSYDKLTTDGISALRWGLVGLFSVVVLFASLQALKNIFDRSADR